MATRVHVEFDDDEDRTLEWPADAPLPEMGYRMEIEDEPFEIVSVVLACWPQSDPGEFSVTMHLKAAFTA